jgi:UDP-N-acetyl-D-mannosaminuronic acid dehydrogenase
LTAEIVKTLENAYRDVRIAYATEIARYCDETDLDFYSVRDKVNKRLAQEDSASNDPNAIPSGGLLIPTIGVGGHCLPKDGILLLWRMLEKSPNITSSLILESRKINDESPSETVRMAEKHFGRLDGWKISLLGTAYRFNSEDTRNSPTLQLARLMLEKGYNILLHDPYVKPDDQKLKLFELDKYFTPDSALAFENADLAIFCTAHRVYTQKLNSLLRLAPNLKGIFDGCNLLRQTDMNGISIAGIGHGNRKPTRDFVDFVYEGFRIMERGFTNELNAFIKFANNNYAGNNFNFVEFTEVQRIAATCVTGCDIIDPGPVENVPQYDGFVPRLVKCAKQAWDTLDNLRV